MHKVNDDGEDDLEMYNGPAMQIMTFLMIRTPARQVGNEACQQAHIHSCHNISRV